jgi:protein-L-isoaspartate O-methyltransferase
MVIPVGDPLGYQELTVVEKAADGTAKARQVIPVRFVPLTR